MTIQQEFYEFWDLTKPVYPPRSRLYHLIPIGIGTPLVESITGYTARLAEAHCISLSYLLRKEIMPIFGRTYLQNNSSNLHKFWRDSSAINGLNKSTRDFVEVLEKLTLHSNLILLTMFPWVNIFSTRGLIRKRRAWCTACYQDWRDSGNIVYDPLLWTLEIVIICPVHNQILKYYCHYSDCQNDSYQLTANMRAGYCSFCQRWLGIRQNPVFNANNIKIQYINNEMDFATFAMDLLCNSVKVRDSINTLNISKAINAYIENFGDGVVSEDIAKHIGVSRYTIRDWGRGIQKPRLDTFFKACIYLSTKPLDFLNGSFYIIKAEQLSYVKHNRVLKRKIRRHPKTLRLKKYLEQVLYDSNEPISMQEVSKKLGCDQSYLRNRHPEICKAISKRYMGDQQYKAEERKMRLYEKIKAAIYNIHAQGLYPSQTKICELLRSTTIFLTPGARTAWQNLLSELGWKSYTIDSTESKIVEA